MTGYESGKPTVVRSKHVVQENIFWGIEGYVSSLYLTNEPISFILYKC